MTSRVLSLIVLIFSFAFAPDARAEMSPAAKQKLYDEIAPSLVAVKYTWEHEMGRQELIGAGIVVSDDGLVMTAMNVFDMRIPDDQMKDFQVIVPLPDEDALELDATFVGRDERTNMALVRVQGERDWKPVKFVESPPGIGEPVYSIGLLPKIAGYRVYLMEAVVSAHLRGETPQALVGAGGLAAIGSPVFNDDGEAIGVVNQQPEQTVFLNNPRNAMQAIDQPPKFFVPTRFFELSLTDPPIAGEPMKLPWIGVPQLTGLNKEVAEFYNLKNQPAIEIGDIIPGTPADQGGLKRGQIIVKLDGQPLERGDEPEELPGILRRHLIRKKIGDEITLTILPAPGEALQDVTLTLGEQPKRANLAQRFQADDLGFTAREVVFFDTYVRKLEPNHGGVVISFIKPQGAAQNAKMEREDLVLSLNGEDVKDLPGFQAAYEAFRRESPREAVVLVVLRDGKDETIRIEPPQ